MTWIEHEFSGEIVDVYILSPSSDEERAIASCDRVKGNYGCPFASTIDRIPLCRAITQTGAPEGSMITFGEIYKRSPVCQPGQSRLAIEGTVIEVPPALPPTV